MAGVARKARGSGEAVPRELLARPFWRDRSDATVPTWIRDTLTSGRKAAGLAASCRVEWPDRWL